MPPTVSDYFREAAYAQETGAAVLPLLTISNKDLNPTVYLVRDAVSFTSRGHTFLPYPFNVTLPNEQADQMPTTTIEIDNISREIIRGIRLLDTPPRILLELVAAAEPDAPIIGLDLTMIEAKYDALLIRCTLAWEKYLNEPYPAHSVTPGAFPAVFAMKG